MVPPLPRPASTAEVPLFAEPPAPCGPRLRVGTSGWSNLAWGSGALPAGIPSAQRLSYLASQLDTVELNTTFYRAPTPRMVHKWIQAVGPGFRFSVKLSRDITHERRLRDCQEPLNEFLTSVAEFGDKSGALLIQLPPSLRPGWRELDRLLHLFRANPVSRRWQPVVEFRNRAWLTAQTLRVLDGHDTAWCVSDAAACPTVLPNAGGPVYVRRHGTVRMYQGGYSHQQIAADAAALRPYLDAGRDVYVYFNNTMDHQAYANALELNGLVPNK